MGISCKNCGGTLFVKNGMVRNQQRYRCKECGSNFIPGDKRDKLSLDGRVIAALLHGEGKYSLRDVSELLDVSHVAVLKSIKELSKRGLQPVNYLPIKKIPKSEIIKFISHANSQYKNDSDWIICELKPSTSLVGYLLLKNTQA
jgi:transposase-like protein